MSKGKKKKAFKKEKEYTVLNKLLPLFPEKAEEMKEEEKRNKTKYKVTSTFPPGW